MTWTAANGNGNTITAYVLREATARNDGSATQDVEALLLRSSKLEELPVLANLPEAINGAPIASVTKIMTAYLVLKDHPLVGRSNGPVFVMTGKDHQAWIQASEDGDSNIEILTGERLNERQLLQALMIPSAARLR